MTPRKLARYGWRKDSLDHRDMVMRSAAPPTILPPSADLRQTGFMPPVYDQGQLGSCTANAVAAAKDYQRRKQRLLFMSPSRLFIYYNERVIENDVNQDGGAELRDGCKTVSNQGACPESEWPYDLSKFATAPPLSCYDDASRYTTTMYLSIPQTAAHIKTAVAGWGSPVVFGFSVFAAFESDAVASSGVVPMPSNAEAPIGGHAVCIVGYDDTRGQFICRNSWGADWGIAGYFYIPYAFLLNPRLASDFWTLNQETKA